MFKAVTNELADPMQCDNPIDKDNTPHLHVYILSLHKARAQTAHTTHKAGQVITSTGRV